MSYEEEQVKWIKENDVKVGDKVKVLRAAESYEGKWGTCWGDHTMDDMVGGEFEIAEIDGECGFQLDNKSGDWWFPFFCLQKVSSNETPVLKTGMIVELENGQKYLCADLGGGIKLIEFSTQGWLTPSFSEGEDGIIKVWDIAKPYALSNMITEGEWGFDWEPDVIWEAKSASKELGKLAAKLEEAKFTRDAKLEILTKHEVAYGSAFNAWTKLSEQHADLKRKLNS